MSACQIWLLDWASNFLCGLIEPGLARAAFKSGALDFITKPWSNDELLVQVAQAVEVRRLREENVQLKRALKQRYNFPNIIGKSDKMLAVLDLVSQVAPSRSTVMIHGESGTGKELIAKAIHSASTRADKAFVPINTGSIPVDLLESQLFGHVKGAFTSAVASKKGLFEVADQGTIFFDEISTIGPETQAKLLRVIQEREFMRLGGTETIKVDVRIIAACNVQLLNLVREGRFREDLYHRHRARRHRGAGALGREGRAERRDRLHAGASHHAGLHGCSLHRGFGRDARGGSQAGQESKNHRAARAGGFGCGSLGAGGFCRQR